jgi:hypothetical protein
VEPEFVDKKMQSSTEFLKDFTKNDGTKLTADEIGMINKTLHLETISASTYKFPGTLHVEANMMASHMLALHADALYDKNMDESTIDHAKYVRLPPRDIIDHFKQMKDIIPVSKRPCPSCSSLIEYYKTLPGLSKLYYGGSLASWTPCAIAPWMPRAAALAMMTSMENELRARFEYLFETEKARRERSTSADTATIHMKAGFDDDDESDDDDLLLDLPSPPTKRPASEEPEDQPESKRLNTKEGEA